MISLKILLRFFNLDKPLLAGVIVNGNRKKWVIGGVVVLGDGGRQSGDWPPPWRKQSLRQALVLRRLRLAGGVVVLWDEGLR